MTLSGAGPLTISGATNKFFTGSVANSGTWIWNEGLVYSNAPDSSITNSGLIDLQGDGSSFSLNHTGSLNNSAGGILRRSTGTGTASISLAVNNQGTIEVDSGTLQLSEGGSSSGSFQIDGGASLYLGNFTLEEGATSTGDGFIYVSGTLQATGEAHIENIELTSGTLVGDLHVDGQLNWNSGGTLADGVVLGAGSQTTVTSSGYPYRFFDGTVTNQGTFTWEGAYITPNGGGNDTFVNEGIVELNGSDGTGFSPQFGAGTFENACWGHCSQQRGSRLVGLDLPITNAGTIEQLSGTTSYGTIDNTGLILPTAGTMNIAGGSLAGDFEIAAGASLHLSSFTLEEGATSTGDGFAYVNGGTLQATGEAHVENIEFSSGTLVGDLHVDGQLNWNGSGTLADGVVLGEGSQTTVTSASYPYRFFDGTVTNHGTFTWEGAYITPNGGGNDTFVNEGIVELNGSDGSGFSPQFGAGTFVNAAGGVVRRDVAEGSASLGLPIDNLGTIEVTLGILSLSGGLSNLDAPTNTLLGGTYRAVDSGSAAALQVPGASVATIAIGTTVELSGSNAVITYSGTTLENSLVSSAGTLRIFNGHHFAMSNALNNTGTVELGGTGLAGGTLTSAGDITNAIGATISGHGTINSTILNSGTVRASSGALAIVGGAIDGNGGTVQVDIGTTLDLSAASGASDADFLIHNGVGLNLGTNNFLVGKDYSNANFGVGNSFNARANITGSGQIDASPGIGQTLSGNVSAGGTATATMNFGNRHVGSSTTLNFQINNSGANGASLRGAIQTTVGGANLTDSRLSGTGVTASNFAAIAPGADSGNRAVTFAPTTAGSLTGQRVRIVNNFDNVGDQILQFTGAAYRLANPTSHTPEPVNLGNRHVGDPAPSQAVSLTNSVPADGFSESLNASIGAPTGGVTTNGGSFTALAPSATNNSSLAVGYSTATAGNKAGTATISLVSNGTGSSGLGLTTLASQTVSVTGGVYRLASPSTHTPEPVNIGIVHVGDVVAQPLTINNTAVNDGYSERLNATLGSPTGGVTTNGGSITGLVPGATNSTNLIVGVNTVAAGIKSGTATIELTSTGVGTSGLANTTLASQTVNVSAQVNNFALPKPVKAGGDGAFVMTGLNDFTLNFGTVVEGTGVFTAELGVLNDVAAPADSLAGTFAVDALGFSTIGFDSFADLAAGSTHGELFVGLDTATPGTLSGVITLMPRSTNPNPFSLDLPAMTLHLTGFVRRPGDFDNDLDVDGRDFLLWQRGGSPNPLSSSDLAEWQAHYGTLGFSAISELSAGAVPEPTGSALCLVSLALVATKRRFL